MASLIDVLRNGEGLGMGESYIPVLHRSSCFTNEDFSPFAGNPVDHAVLFSQVEGVT